MTRRSTKQSGFATFSAVALAGLIGLSLLVAATATMNRVERLRDRSYTAQLDQIMAAAVVDAYAPGSTLELGQVRHVSLPEALVNREGKATLERRGETVVIHATYEGQSLHRELVLP